MACPIIHYMYTAVKMLNKTDNPSNKLWWSSTQCRNKMTLFPVNLTHLAHLQLWLQKQKLPYTEAITGEWLPCKGL